MKRRFNIVAKGTVTTTTVSILVDFGDGYTREEANDRASDILDKLIVALGTEYRPSEIKLA